MNDLFGIVDWRGFFSQIFLGNSYERWATAILILVSGYTVIALLRRIVMARLRKLAPRTVSRIDDLFLLWTEKTHHWFIFVVFLYLAVNTLNLGRETGNAISHVFVLIVFYQLGVYLTNALRLFSEDYTTLSEHVDAGRATTMRALFFMGHVLIWAGVLLLILDNWGVKISALVAGLGVSGLAVAFAVQNILTDLFASFSIVFDKPFVIGDFINAGGGDMGTVEKIGLKTTRVRSLSGEQLIFSNSDLLRARLRNFKRQQERRVEQKVGVTYETDPEKLAAIPGMIRGFLEKMADVRFERAHVGSFSDSAINIEYVWWVTKPDFNLYMDRQQELQMNIVRSFKREGIEIAYPTRKIFMDGKLQREPESEQPGARV